MPGQGGFICWHSIVPDHNISNVSASDFVLAPVLVVSEVMQLPCKHMHKKRAAAVALTSVFFTS